MAGDLDSPIFHGRFNYMGVRHNAFDVVFRSSVGGNAIVVASGLLKIDAFRLMEELNESLEYNRKQLGGKSTSD